MRASRPFAVHRFRFRIHQYTDRLQSSVGNGNSRIIPISSGNFVAQFVSRKEYDIMRSESVSQR